MAEHGQPPIAPPLPQRFADFGPLLQNQVNTMHIHIVLVSDQVLPNLIPALMERPDRVVLVATPAMSTKGMTARLARLLRREGIDVAIREQAPDAGLSRIQDYALDLAAWLEGEHPDARITLNATGGTKLMALGFIEIFRGQGRILYTDTAHRCIEVLPDGKGQTAPPIPMNDVLDVPTYLAAQGFVFERAASDAADWREGAATRKRATKYLGQNATALGGFIGALNRLADLALEPLPGSREERLTHPEQTLDQPPRGDWSKALGQLLQAGLIDWREGSPAIAFTSVEAALYLRGGWLEEYAWHIVKDAGIKNAGIGDVRLGVEGHWGNSPTSTNEFDVLATHNNQLLFIECKTLRFQGGNDNEIAYKVDSLGDAARGLFGATWLLSARQPTQVLQDRAKQARIGLIGPDQLPRLKEVVQQWMEPNP